MFLYIYIYISEQAGAVAWVQKKAFVFWRMESSTLPSFLLIIREIILIIAEADFAGNKDWTAACLQRALSADSPQHLQ